MVKMSFFYSVYLKVQVVDFFFLDNITNSKDEESSNKELFVLIIIS